MLHDAHLPGLWILFILAGWAAIDTTEAFQLMIGQPIVIASLAGLAAGDFMVALPIGAALQMAWSRLSPVGAAAYPDVGPATVAGVAVAAWLARLAPPPAVLEGPGRLAGAGSAAAHGPLATVGSSLVAGLLVALVAGWIGQWFTVWVRRDNRRLAGMADAAARRGSFAGVERANGLGVARAFLRGGLLFLLTAPPAFLLLAPAGTVLRRLDRALPAAATPAGALTLVWVTGLAALVSSLWRGGRRDWLVLAGGIAGGVVVAVLVR